MDWLRAITDRGVQVLLVPEDARPVPDSSSAAVFHDATSAAHNLLEEADGLSRLALHSAWRAINSCFAYSSSGRVANSTVSVRFDPPGGSRCDGNRCDLIGWMGTIFTDRQPTPLPVPPRLAHEMNEAAQLHGGRWGPVG